MFVLLALGAMQPASAENILFYGNSFTNGSGSTDSVPNLVRDIATAAGQVTPTVVNAAVNGQSFTWHLANNTSIISSGLSGGETWDYAVMQNFSTAPTHLGNVTQHRADSVSLYQTIAAHSAAVTPVLFETWARGPGHSFYTGGSPNFPGGPSQMQQEVRDGYELARQDIDAVTSGGFTRVAEVGDRWEETNWNNLHSGDIYHANNRGTLLAALEIYSNIYEDDTSDIDLSGVLNGLNLTSFEGDYLTAFVDGNDPPEPYTPINYALKFDFGDSSHPHPNYNTVPTTSQNVSNALDFSTGFAMGVGLTVTSATGFDEGGPNTNGTTSPGAPASDFFDGDATNRNVFGHDTNFGIGSPRPLVEYTVDGLDPDRTYDFTFFASRLGAGDNRETQYDVAGINAGVDFLDPAGNSSEIAQVASIQPTAAGEIFLTIQKGPSNVNSQGFFYLGAMEIRADLQGDYNDDGQVDMADYTAWQVAFGTAGSSLADGNGDGTVDAADYTLWRDAFEEAQFEEAQAASASEAVPEPSTALLALVLLVRVYLNRPVLRPAAWIRADLC